MLHNDQKWPIGVSVEYHLLTQITAWSHILQLVSCFHLVKSILPSLMNGSYRLLTTCINVSNVHMFQKDGMRVTAKCMMIHSYTLYLYGIMFCINFVDSCTSEPEVH